MLMDEVNEIGRVSFKYSVCEIAQSKIYRVY